jgi:hypothetical protein
MNDQNTIKGKVKISPQEEVDVPIRFQMTKFIPSVVAQHVTIQGTTGNVLVSFYEANPPVMFNPTPESLEALQEDGIIVECVARISIPTALFPGIADVFSQIAEQAKPKEKRSKDAIPQQDQR